MKRCLRFINSRMKIAAITSFVFFIFIASVSSNVKQSNNVSHGPAELPVAQAHVQLDRIFAKREILELDLKGMAEQTRSTSRLRLNFNGLDYDLELEPNDLRSASYRSTITTDEGETEEPHLPTITFKGKVAGNPDSEVRLLLQQDLFFGYIRIDEDLLFIDPVSKYVPGVRPEKVVVYREADIRPEFRGICGATGLGNQTGHLFEEIRPSDSTPVAITSSPRSLEIATDADFEFFLRNGEASNNAILGVLNQVDGIYLQELNLSISVSFQNVYGTAKDPYTSTEPNALLDEFKNHWNSNRTTIGRDLAHLFTGKNLDGITAGIAFIRVVCSKPGDSYGLSQQQANFTRLVAHEIGHNLGGDHDDNSICKGNGPIMCAILQDIGSNQFSQKSKDDIATQINNFGTCLQAGSGLWVGRSNGPGFDTSQWDIWVTYPDMKELAGDFNGDGKTDVMKFDVPSSGISQLGLWVGLSDGSKFNTSRWGIWDTYKDMKVLAGDFNGDGKTDVMKFDISNSCNSGLWVGLSYGNGFNTSLWATWCTNTRMKVLGGDFNGDHRTDVMKFDVP